MKVLKFGGSSVGKDCKQPERASDSGGFCARRCDRPANQDGPNGIGGQ